MRQVLQNATVLLKNTTVITKCDVNKICLHIVVQKVADVQETTFIK